VIALLIGLALTPSSPSESAAEALRAAVLGREREALAREPAVVAAKLARMARTPFAFFRGTAWRMVRDPSRCATPASSQVAVVGDPHPENVGTYPAPGGGRIIDFNDFDLAGWGSYVDDLRRLTLGLALIADMAELRPKQRARVVEAAVDGYLTEVAALAAGHPPLALREEELAGDLEEVLAAPDEEAAAGKQSPATAEETALARTLLTRYPASLLAPGRYPARAFTPKSVYRLHAGVASFSNLRLRVLVEGPTSSPDDDWWLELKEAPLTPAAVQVQIQRQFQERPDDDPLLGWATAGDRQFRIRQITSAQRRLDADRLAKRVRSPAWKRSDLRDLAGLLGQLLARGHCRSQASGGKPGLPAIVAAVGDGRCLREEIAAYVERQTAAVENEWRTLRQLLADRGPLLGWRP
jgi:hypothetical protein